MNPPATCLLCSHRALRHVCAGNLYWYCCHCRQSIPTHEMTSGMRHDDLERSDWPPHCSSLIDLYPAAQALQSWYVQSHALHSHPLSSISQRG
ncbi:MAG: hypothetical protein KME16_25890 [Scytolyngbya sp. HA4215-MV1]|nr:hypothetical protein [Scytolyngbya sp. HA4215-MV1]